MRSFVAHALMATCAAAALAATTAHAASVHWSIGIQAPIAPGVAVGTVITNGHGFPVVAPVFAPHAVVVPAPVVYAPSIYAPPAYAPAGYPAPLYGPPIYAPRVVVGPPVWVGGRWARGPVHRHPYPGVWRPGFDHRAVPVPVRRPGREIRY